MTRFSSSFSLALCASLALTFALCASLTSCDIHRPGTETGGTGSEKLISDTVAICWRNDSLIWEMDATYASYCAFYETAEIEASGKSVTQYARDEVTALVDSGCIALQAGYGHYLNHYVTRQKKDGTERLKTGVSYTAFGLYMSEKDAIISKISSLTFVPENQ